MSSSLKVLILDYETSPAKGYFWGSIWETNIIEVIEYEQILCVGWRWYGEKKAHVIGQDDFKSYKKGKLNDKDLVKFFVPILQKADVIIGHNSDQFDIKVFNTRLLHYRLPTIPINKSIDTKKISKGQFHLPSNKLDDIADFLEIDRKLAHTGKNMWLGCEQGVEKDWRLMKKYCGKWLRRSCLQNKFKQPCRDIRKP
jgi:DNA polymerase elongation subunit (family B)